MILFCVARLILFWTLHLTLLLQTPGWILEDVWTMLESSKLSILSMLVVVTPTHTMVLYPDSMMVELGLLYGGWSMLATMMAPDTLEEMVAMVARSRVGEELSRMISRSESI